MCSKQFVLQRRTLFGKTVFYFFCIRRVPDALFKASLRHIEQSGCGSGCESGKKDTENNFFLHTRLFSYKKKEKKRKKQPVSCSAVTSLLKTSTFRV